jgi:hypothetical protein
MLARVESRALASSVGAALEAGDPLAMDAPVADDIHLMRADDTGRRRGSRPARRTARCSTSRTGAASVP